MTHEAHGTPRYAPLTCVEALAFDDRLMKGYYRRKMWYRLPLVRGGRRSADTSREEGSRSGEDRYETVAQGKDGTERQRSPYAGLSGL